MANEKYSWRDFWFSLLGLEIVLLLVLTIGGYHYCGCAAHKGSFVENCWLWWPVIASWGSLWPAITIYLLKKTDDEASSSQRRGNWLPLIWIPLVALCYMFRAEPDAPIHDAFQDATQQAVQRSHQADSIPIPGIAKEAAKDWAKTELPEKTPPIPWGWWLILGTLAIVGWWLLGSFKLPTETKIGIIAATLLFLQGGEGLLGQILGWGFLLYLITQLPGLIKWLPALGRWVIALALAIVVLAGLGAYYGVWSGMAALPWKLIFRGLAVIGVLAFLWAFNQDRNAVLKEEEAARLEAGQSKKPGFFS